jgi:hypothetical protein
LLLVFYISGHGLGHASRDIELIRTLRSTQPDLRVVVRTAAPRWVFPNDLEYQECEADTGVAQIDSLRLDERETARRAKAFYADFDARVDDEARMLDRLGATLVAGDIPPLAFAAAARAGLRSVAIGNFTWDWIYCAYAAFEATASGVIERIADAYSHATHALRLPMHGGFAPMASVTTDIPFIARHATREPSDTRRRLNITSDRPVVLVSFGGYGLQASSYHATAEAQGLTLVHFERNPPPGVSYPDIVAAADVVVTKPGYGIISECIANGTAMVYTSRGHFAEYDVLVREMPRFLRSRYLEMEDLVAGRWTDAVRDVLAQPAAPETPRTDGAHVAAQAIVSLSL